MDAFRRSLLCDLPPHAPATMRPRRCLVQKNSLCRDSKDIRSSVPNHLVGSAYWHLVFLQIFYVGLCMVQCVLLRKHLGTILLIFPIPDDTASEYNWPRRGHIELPTIYQLRRPVKSIPVAPFGDRHLPLLPLSLNRNRNSLPSPWFTPFRFSKVFPTQKKKTKEARPNQLVTAGSQNLELRLDPVIPAPKCDL